MARTVAWKIPKKQGTVSEVVDRNVACIGNYIVMVEFFDVHSALVHDIFRGKIVYH